MASASESGEGVLRRGLQGEVLFGMRCFSTDDTVKRPHVLF